MVKLVASRAHAEFLERHRPPVSPDFISHFELVHCLHAATHEGFRSVPVVTTAGEADRDGNTYNATPHHLAQGSLAEFEIV